MILEFAEFMIPRYLLFYTFDARRTIHAFTDQFFLLFCHFLV